MEFSFPPQNLAEVFGFFAVMFIVMLAFYFLGQWLHSTRPEDESHCRQNGGIPKQAGRACLQGYDEIGRSNRQYETLAVWPTQVVRKKVFSTLLLKPFCFR